MKNILVSLLSIVVAVLIGSLFMKVTDDDETIKVMEELNQIKAFQAGAFLDEEKAAYEAALKHGITVFDGNYYCVYLAILSDNDLIEKMINYLNDENINYYIKSINVSDEFRNELYSLETMLKETNTSVAFNQLNERILEKYEVLK